MAEVRFTANFNANLADIQTFLQAHEAANSFDRLLDALEETVIPNLEQFPLMGRLYALNKASVEGVRRIDRISARFGAVEVREYLTADYLLLYTVRQEVVYLLCVRHHRQLAFDFGGL